MSGADPSIPPGPWDDGPTAASVRRASAAVARPHRTKLDSQRFRTAIWLNIAFQTVITAAIAFFVLRLVLAR